MSAQINKSFFDAIVLRATEAAVRGVEISKEMIIDAMRAELNWQSELACCTTEKAIFAREMAAKAVFAAINLK